MQLNQIELNGFRQLVNRSFEFKPGLNVVYGPNEAGKSTLMEAIAIMLYGFFDSGRISAKERDALNENKPWAYMGAFGGTLRYRLKNDEVFQIQRTFAPEVSSVLTKLPSEKNLAAKFRTESDGRVYFAEEQLGISKAVFESVYVVRQSELALLENSAAPITEAIMRLSSTMAADGLTVNEALDNIDKTLKQKVGTLRAHSKPLAMTKKQLEQLEKTIDEARTNRQQTWGKLSSTHSGKADLSQLEEEYRDTQILLLKSKLSQLTENLSRIVTLQDELEEANKKLSDLQKWEGFRSDIYEELLNLDTKRVSYEAENLNINQESVEKIAALEMERKEITSQLENSKSIPVELVEAISAKKNEIAKAKQSLDLAQSQTQKFQEELDKARDEVEILSKTTSYLEKGHASLAKVQHQYESVEKDLEKSKKELEAHIQAWKRVNMTEESFLALKETPLDKPPKKGCRFLKRAANPEDKIPSEIVIYNDLLPIYTNWKNSQATVEKIERSKHEFETTIKQEYSFEVAVLDSNTFQQASSKIDEYLKKVTTGELAVQNLADAQRGSDEAQRLLESLESQLAEILPEGIQKNDDIQNAQQELHKLRLRLTDIEMQLDSLRSEDAKWQQKNDEYQRSMQQLHSLYSEAGINEEINLEEKLTRYKSEREMHFDWQDAKRVAKSAELRLKEFPFQAERLSKQIAEIQQQLQVFADQKFDVSSLTPIETTDFYETELDKLNQRLQNLKQEQILSASLSSQVSQNVANLAELLEEHAQVKAHLSHLEWFALALQTAQKELTKASADFQKQFAPRLQAYLDEGLGFATGGRYTESQVDPETLEVSLLAPETHTWIHIDRLSTGTKDLVYLLLRFSIARLMSSSVEHIPMLLDDPFVHCDRSRKTNILNYLANHASDTQFLLFTQDEWTLAWLNANHPNCNKIIMSHDTNVSIDYALVETLTDQSDAVRTRLLAAELEGNLEFVMTEPRIEDVSLLEANLTSADNKHDDLEMKTLQDISTILLSNEMGLKILRVFEQSNWVATDSEFADVLEGQFLNVILDSINQDSLDILGDQLIYNDGHQWVVTEEYQPALGQFLNQRG